jgi:hypothetical protein
LVGRKLGGGRKRIGAMVMRMTSIYRDPDLNATEKYRETTILSEKHGMPYTSTSWPITYDMAYNYIS